MNQVITEKDFQYFKKRCEYWIDFFQLSDWQVIIKIKSLEIDSCGARTIARYQGRFAQIILNSNRCEDAFQFTDKKEELDRYAFHEVRHIALEPIACLVESAFVTFDEFKANLEGVIVREESTIWKRLRNGS